MLRRMFLSGLGAAILGAGLWPAPTLADERFIVVASTTSTQDSGLFDYLLPLFTKKTGIEVRVVAKGTGQAIDLAKKGDADVLFVHDKKSEEKFVADGFGVKRFEVMYNDFIIVGPQADPAGIKGASDAPAALAKIAAAAAPFASRGDDSGTHKAELRLWKEAGLRVVPGRYLARDQADGSNPGLGYIRVAMVHDQKTTAEALHRLVAVLG